MANDQIIRFSGYQLDPGARSLKHEGRAIPLAPKTFDLLVFLATHPHQVVTKEELLAALWPNAFVEERNLSQHVFLLRKALGSAGQGEQVVATVPGKGYQFTAAMEQGPGEPANPGKGELVLHAVQSVTRMVLEEESDDEEPTLKELSGGQKRRRWLVWTAAAVGLAAVAAGLHVGWRELHPDRAGHVDLVLSELENRTGDTDFDRVLNQALTIDLEQSPYLNLLSRSRIRETLTQMQQPKDATLTPALAHEICERNNAQAVLNGTIARLGSSYVLILDADSCVSGKQIAGYRAQAASKEEVLGALDEAAGRVRTQLGESRASRERFQTPVAQATTPSLAALRAFSKAAERFEHGDMKGAQGLLEGAIALDPNFATAYRSLGSTYYNRADFAQAGRYIKKAYDLRDRTTERERLGIEIAYHAYGEYDYEATIRSMQVFNQIYPNDAGNWGNLCNMYTQLGDYPAAITAGEQSYRIDPHLGVGMTILARAYKRANRFEDAKRIASAAIAEGRDHWGLHSILFQIAFAEHDAAKIKSEGEWGLTHGSAHESLDDLGFAAASGGKLREAGDDFSRARAEALRDGATDFANGVVVDQAIAQIRLEEMRGAAETLKLLKGYEGQLGSDASTQADVAMLKAELGDVAPGQHLLATLGDGGGTKETILVYCKLPLLRALLALKEHKPAEAVQLLEPALPYEMRGFEVPYLRARAETEAGMLDAAAADYRLILANEGVDPISPMYSLAHLRLGRVLALEKEPDEARKEYRAFFEAWKDADAELKLLVEARHEFEQLR